MFRVCVYQSGYESIWETSTIAKAISRLDTYKDMYLDTAQMWIDKDGTVIYEFDREDVA